MISQIHKLISSRGRPLQSDTIINNGLSTSDTTVRNADVKLEGQHLIHYRTATRDKVSIVIMKCPPKSYEHDPMPTYPREE